VVGSALARHAAGSGKVRASGADAPFVARAGRGSQRIPGYGHGRLRSPVRSL